MRDLVAHPPGGARPSRAPPPALLPLARRVATRPRQIQGGARSVGGTPCLTQRGAPAYRCVCPPPASKILQHWFRVQGPRAQGRQALHVILASKPGRRYPKYPKILPLHWGEVGESNWPDEIAFPINYQRIQDARTTIEPHRKQFINTRICKVLGCGGSLNILRVVHAGCNPSTLQAVV